MNDSSTDENAATLLRQARISRKRISQFVDAMTAASIPTVPVFTEVIETEYGVQPRWRPRTNSIPLFKYSYRVIGEILADRIRSGLEPPKPGHHQHQRGD